MKIVNVKQGSPEWIKARLGLPTASEFDQIITPKTLQESASSGKYAVRLATEWFLGRPLDETSSGFMARGTDMEAEAAAWFEFETGMDTEPVGLCVRDQGDCGASPDRLIGSDGLLEIKCPSAETHAEQLLFSHLNPMWRAPYRLQVQAQLWVTGRKYAYLLHYNPSLPSVLTRVEPDADVFAAFETVIPAFATMLEGFKDTLSRLAGRQAAVAEAFQDTLTPF